MEAMNAVSSSPESGSTNSFCSACAMRSLQSVTMGCRFSRSWSSRPAWFCSQMRMMAATCRSTMSLEWLSVKSFWARCSFSLADIGASLPPFVAVRVPTVETNPVTLEPGLLPTDAIGAEWATAIMAGGR